MQPFSQAYRCRCPARQGKRGHRSDHPQTVLSASSAPDSEKFLFSTGAFRETQKSAEKTGDFVLDAPRYAKASILSRGKNFGCGSWREHAVWALAEFSGSGF